MRYLFLIAAMLTAAPLCAQTRKAGQPYDPADTRFNGTGGTDYSNWYPLRTDAQGHPMVDDVDRDRDKTDALTLLSAVSLAANTSTNVSTFVPFTQSYADAIKWLLVTITGGSAGAPWSLALLGSDDASNFSFLMQSPPSVAGISWVDADTLKIRGHGPTPANGILIPVVTRIGYPVITKNLAVIARHDSSAAAAALVFTVKAFGRGS